MKLCSPNAWLSKVFILNLVLFGLAILSDNVLANEGKGKIFQALEFEYQYIQNNYYYQAGDIVNEYEDSIVSRNENSLGANYIFRSRTGYQYWIFTSFIEYTFSINEDNQYNGFDTLVRARSTSVNIHEIIPYVFFHYDPWGLNLGINYYSQTNGAEQVGTVWSLKENNSLGFLFHFFWPQFFDIPVGLSLDYEIAFPLNALSNLYQRAAFGFYIHFAYYSQFQILYTFVNSQKDQTISRGIVGENVTEHFLDATNRYYLDFILTFQISPNFSLKLGMGQLLYSEFESRAFRFNGGISYSLDIY